MKTDSAGGDPHRKLAAKVVGLGGAGAKVAECMARTDLKGIEFLAVHSNARDLAQIALERKLLLGSKLMRGMGAGGDPDLGKAAAEEEVTELREIAAGADLVFLLAGLGGGTATGAAPVAARLAKETGALVLALVTLPFDFEGPRRQRQAQAGLRHLKTAADGVICLPHQKIARLLDENTSLLDTFKLTDDLLAQGIRGIWQMLSRPGLISVDFADLCSILRGRHSESCFATAQAEGENRARHALDQVLASPFLDNGQMLAEAESVLVSLVAGPDLSMAEVNRVMEQINRRAENAHLLMGAAVAEHLQGRFGVTVVASRPSGIAAESDDAGGDSSNDSSESAALPEMDNQFFGAAALPRPMSRFVPPPPEMTWERKKQLASESNTSNRPRRSPLRWLQAQLPLEIVSKGRFEKSEPTIRGGQDLDVPTYIRRGIVLN